ncbi:MAG: hypothetical protein E7030_03840 [Akkermansiaceae bacterium]|nr:hypothetical protein [Akkermansiaceae bacterium]
MMNKSLLLLAALPATLPAVAAEPAKSTDWADEVKKALVVYENKDTFINKVNFTIRQQWQMASVQPNGSNGLHLRKGAAPFNSEFRRSWLGLNVNMSSGTQFNIIGRVGGLPSRSTYTSTGRTKRNFTYTDLYSVWVKQNIPAVKGLSIKAGKFAPNFTLDYRISNANITCVERSYICNQFGMDTNWGVELNYTSPDKKNILYLELMANDRACASKKMDHGDVYRDGRGLKGEFGWEDKCFIILGGTHKFDVTEKGYQAISAEYMHDFNNAYHGRRNPGANNYGLGFKDALSIGYEMKQDKLTLQANVVAAFEQQTGHGTNNIGLQLQPIYAIHPQVDLVFRYTGMTGDGACKLSGDRYIYTQTYADAWVDSLHAFYFGVDLYASAKHKDAAKLMFGAEYTTARKDGSDCYNGWEFTTALRFNF